MKASPLTRTLGVPLDRSGRVIVEPTLMVAGHPGVYAIGDAAYLETPAGPVVMPGTPIKLSDTPAAIRTPPPRFGEHTDAVLAELGLDVAAIARLRAERVVG